MLRTDGVIIDGDGCLCLPTGTSFPASPSEGQFFFRTDTHTAHYYDGTAWQEFVKV